MSSVITLFNSPECISPLRANIVNITRFPEWRHEPANVLSVYFVGVDLSN